jgi:HEAT repeat protein
MTEREAKRVELREQILSDNLFEAETLAPEMAGDAHRVLQELAGNNDAHVRSNVLELAGTLGGADCGRLILRGLDDPNWDVKEVAASLIDVCAHRELLPEIVKAMEDHDEPSIRGDLALQVGMIGTEEQIPILQRYRREASDDELNHKLSLALARLGDTDAKGQVVAGLHSSDTSVRFSALQDCLYIQDKDLVRHFGPALEDYQEVVVLTIPEETPTVTARICDVAVSTMANLGYPLSYSAEDLWVRTLAELEEARKIVQGLAAKTEESPNQGS